MIMVASIAAGAVVADAAGDTQLPESIQAGGQRLVLNGVGLRKKAFIKVYAGGLYLADKSSDAQAIIAADEPMVVRMHFIYDGVAPKKLVEAWNEGFDASTNGNTSPIADHIDAFNGLFDQEAGEGDVYEVAYLAGSGIQVSFNGTVKGTVDGGLDFKKAVFGIWLGEEPVDKGLRAGMLGSD
jgi:hypothetical protein